MDRERKESEGFSGAPGKPHQSWRLADWPSTLGIEEDFAV